MDAFDFQNVVASSIDRELLGSSVKQQPHTEEVSVSDHASKPSGQARVSSLLEDTSPTGTRLPPPGGVAASACKNPSHGRKLRERKPHQLSQQLPIRSSRNIRKKNHRATTSARKACRTRATNTAASFRDDDSFSEILSSKAPINAPRAKSKSNNEEQIELAIAEKAPHTADQEFAAQNQVVYDSAVVPTSAGLQQNPLDSLQSDDDAHHDIIYRTAFEDVDIDEIFFHSELN